MSPDDDSPVARDQPLIPPIHPASVYRMPSPQAADQRLGQPGSGYVYARDGHPNADLLAEAVARAHGAERGLVCSSGMAALATLVLGQLVQGDHLVASRDLYGRTLAMIHEELPRLGITATIVDTQDLAAVSEALRPTTRMLLVETISNPRLRVADLPALAQRAAHTGAVLVVDNTLAGPAVCRPLQHGAHYVLESLTKIINGHSDATLGFLGGAAEGFDRLVRAWSTWGFTPSPWDCWLTQRGLATLEVRTLRACSTAQQVATFLDQHPAVARVDYPGLPHHPDRPISQQLLANPPGTMVSFVLQAPEAEGWGAAERFIAAVSDWIPFCPSLGDVTTTLSHPASTSHRGLRPEERARLGIPDQMIRLSLGVEDPAIILQALRHGLNAV